MLPRIVLAVAFTVGCVKQAQQVIAPEPEGGGTLTCREIVEQCDSTCSDPLCLHRCTSQGTQDAQGSYAALLDCGQRSGCTNVECMRTNCPTEIGTCIGAEPSELPAEMVQIRNGLAKVIYPKPMGEIQAVYPIPKLWERG